MILKKVLKNAMATVLCAAMLLTFMPGSGLFVAEKVHADSRNDCLTFSSDASFRVRFYDAFDPDFDEGKPTNLEYSLDGSEWTHIRNEDGITEIPSALNNNDKHVIYLRGFDNTIIDGRLVLMAGETQKVDCSGNIETLLDYETAKKGEHPKMDGWAFYCLFKDCKSLATAPELPATELADSCYSHMFEGCTSLESAPDLPATEGLEGGYCYDAMFRGCTSLKELPTITATTIDSDSWNYRDMFRECTSLTSGLKEAQNDDSYSSETQSLISSAIDNIDVLCARTIDDMDFSERYHKAFDLNAAIKVANAIDKLPAAENVTFDDEEDIKAARKAYEALTEDQKSYLESHLEKLKAAEKALEKKGLNDSIKDAEDKLKDKDKYTDDSVKDLQDALDKAKKTANDPNATKDDIDKVKQELDDAIKNLKEKDSGGNSNNDPSKDPNKMGEDGTALGKGASAAAADKAITNMPNDKDPAGSKIMPLKLKSKKQTKSSAKISWSGAAGAAKYVVYGNECGDAKKMQKLTTVTGKSFNVKKLANGKKLRKGKYHKFIVVALDSKDMVVSTSKVVHVVTKGGKNGNHKSVKVSNAKKFKKGLKQGKSLKIKGKAIGKKVKKHVKLRYESSNPAVATVSASGKVKAVGKGSATIIVYAQNGVSKNVKVKVK